MDMERYGDYNEIDESPKGKGPISILIKILIFIVCLAVIAAIAFRIFLFNYYPDSVKKIYYTDSLAEYYRVKEGNIGAETQELRIPYDDPEEGNFFCDNLIVVKGAGQLQCSVRFNTSALADIKAHYKLEEDIDPDDPSNFTFKLVDNYGNEYSAPAYVGYDSFYMYRYYKLAFADVEFLDLGDGTYPEWIRLDIYYAKDMTKAFGSIPIYENNENFSAFEEYKLSSSEVPSDQ